jgi:hypothetical protein
LPPYLERLSFKKPIIHSEFDLINELRNACIKFPLLHVIKDIPIYAKTIRELCLKKHRTKKIELKTIQFIEKSTDLMTWKTFIEKYQNPCNPIVSFHINGIHFLDALIDLGETINTMTKQTMEQL